MRAFLLKMSIWCSNSLKCYILSLSTCFSCSLTFTLPATLNSFSNSLLLSFTICSDANYALSLSYSSMSCFFICSYSFIWVCRIWYSFYYSLSVHPQFLLILALVSINILCSFRYYSMPRFCMCCSCRLSFVFCSSLTILWILIIDILFFSTFSLRFYSVPWPKFRTYFDSYSQSWNYLRSNLNINYVRNTLYKVKLNESFSFGQLQNCITSLLFFNPRILCLPQYFFITARAIYLFS